MIEFGNQTLWEIAFENDIEETEFEVFCEEIFKLADDGDNFSEYQNFEEE